MKRIGLMLGVMGLFAASGCAASRYQARWAGKSAPDFLLTDLDGNEVRLSGFRGKPVLLAFWAHG